MRTVGFDVLFERIRKEVRTLDLPSSVSALDVTEVAQGRLAAPARAAADWIARKVGLGNKLVRLLVTTFCREVHLYLTDPARRYAVRGEVANSIAEHQPAAVIAHSLGSVVTYETLWARPDLQIDLLITLGSPLALPDVIFPHHIPPP